MAISSHWLDDVFANVRDADELLQTLINSPEMQCIAQAAIVAGNKQRKAFDENPKLRAPSASQSIRTVFLNRLNTPNRDEALATAKKGKSDELPFTI